MDESQRELAIYIWWSAGLILIVLTQAAIELELQEASEHAAVFAVISILFGAFLHPKGEEMVESSIQWIKSIWAAMLGADED